MVMSSRLFLTTSTTGEILVDILYIIIHRGGDCCSVGYRILRREARRMYIYICVHRRSESIGEVPTHYNIMHYNL